MQAHGIMSHVRDYVAGLVFRKGQTRTNVIKRKAENVDPAAAQRRQVKLESLCEALFMKKELIASGRIQVLGLDEVRKKMGRRWVGLRDIIYETCEEVIKKYTNSSDVFFRYKEKDFIILFGTSSAEESDARMTLIASEIRRCLFESHGIENVGVRKDVSVLSRDALGAGGFSEQSISETFESRLSRKKKGTVVVPSVSNKNEIDLALVKRVDVPIAEEDAAVAKPVIAEKMAPRHAVRYMPVWDVFKGRLIAFMCVAGRDDEPGAAETHQRFFRGRSASAIAAIDIDILAGLIQWFDEHDNETRNFGIICPVHFSTISSLEGGEKYRVLCQKMSEGMRGHILFMVMGVPVVHMSSARLSEVVSPLKAYGRVLCGHISTPGLNSDLSLLRIAGFDNIGIIARSVSGDGNDAEILNIQSLVNKAKRYLINQTFVLDVDSPDLVTAAIKAGVRYIAGTAVHQSVQNPDEKLHFPDNGFLQLWNNHLKDGSRPH